MIVTSYLGEAVHILKSGHTRTFRPRGEVTFMTPEGRASTAKERSRSNPIDRLGTGGFSARIFVGLKVGQEDRWTVDDVIRIVYETRKAQKRVADASILAQKGIYEGRSGEMVVEPSAQVIVIDLSGAPKSSFVKEMEQLAETLRAKLEQETVILEIQERGIITDVFSVTA